MMPPVKKPPRKEIAQIIMQITATVQRMFVMLYNFRFKKYIVAQYIYKILPKYKIALN